MLNGLMALLLGCMYSVVFLFLFVNSLHQRIITFSFWLLQSVASFLCRRRQAPVQYGLSLYTHASIIGFCFQKLTLLTLNWQEKLVDLLGVAGRRSGLPILVCCSSRDKLDAVCSVVSNFPCISLASLVLNIF